MQGLAKNTTLTVEKEYSANFTEQQKKFCLSLHYNRVNSYLFFDGVKIFKSKAKISEVNAASLCLGNVSKDSSTHNIRKVVLSAFQLRVHNSQIANRFWTFMKHF